MEYIIGVFVSLGIQWLKSKSRISGGMTLFILALVSVAAAAIYTWLSQYTDFWPVLVQVLTVAGAFHNFIIKRFSPDNA